MFQPIVATLAYVMSPGRDEMLLLRRDKRPNDIHYGKCVGLGGRVEPDEDIVSAARREIHEESGLTARQMALRGTVSWPGFGRDGEDWFGFIFRVDHADGAAHRGNHEGTLEWVPVDRLSDVPMWDSDRLWLPMVLDDDPSMFHGHMPYADGRMISWTYSRI